MSQLNFTINLNKYGELKQIEDAEKKVFINFTIFMLIAISFIFGFFFFLNNNLKVKLKNRKNLVTELNREIKKYQSSGEYLSVKDLERIANKSTDRVFWGEKLLALSNEISEKIAITRFSYKNGILSLYGITKVDSKEKEFDLMTEFIKSLKENDDIRADFPEIRLNNTSRDREKDTEIIRFQIDCLKQSARSRGGRS